MSDVEDLSAEKSANSESTVVENEQNDPEDKVEIPNALEGASGMPLSSAEQDVVNASLDICSDVHNKSPNEGEVDTAEDENAGDGTKDATDETPKSNPENAHLRAKLRAIVDSGKHFLQSAALASEEEYERQLSICRELAAVHLKSFNKELLRSCPVIITDATEGFIFQLGDFRTLPLELCYTEKYVTHAGFSGGDEKFSFGYKKFGKGLPTREVFNPLIKKCYEAILKYVHRSGKPFHVLRKKPPGFWAALTILCNRKKELLAQVEVHVSANHYKRQSCELEKLKFLNYFTDGAGKECNVISLQWKEYLSQVGFMNNVLYGKEFLIERFGDLNLRLYPDDHLFSKPSGVDLVCKMVKELLDLEECDPKVSILEVGTGTGIVGMQLSKVCKRVHMLDRADKGSPDHAEENVKLNGIPNCFVHHDDVLQSIHKVTSTLGEDDKVYAVIHNNLDTRRVAAEMEGIASNEKIKKAVYLSFDNKVRGIKQIKALCSPSKDAFVPVKVIPLVIIPCYSDVDVAVLLVRESLLEGKTVKNELSQLEDTAASTYVDASDRNKESEDGGNDDDNEQGEPPSKKKKQWKQQSGSKKAKHKSKKGKRQRFERWQGNRWQGGDRWRDSDEWQDSDDMQEMNIRKVGFPGYKPPSFLSGDKNQKTSKKSYFQQNERWSRWQGYSEGYPERYPEGYPERYPEGYLERYPEGYPERYPEGYPERYPEGYPEEYSEGYSESWRHSQHMNRGFQQRSQNYGNWYSQFNRYRDMDFDGADADDLYEEHWRGYHQYGSSQQQMFDNSDHPQFNSHHQQFSSSQHQQFNSPQNQRFSSSQNQQYSSHSQNQQYNNPQNQHFASQNQQYNSQNHQYTPQNQQYNSQNQQQYNTSQNQQQYNNSQNQQQYNNSQNQQQYNNSQNQLFNNSQNQQYNNSQNQQYNNSQNQHFNTSQQQQFNSLQQQQFNSPQQQQQQFNSTMQMNYDSSLKSAGQQMNYDASAKPSAVQSNYDSSAKSSGQQMNYDVAGKVTAAQASYDASGKPSEPQLNYDASEKSEASNRQFQTYGMDYSSMQQAQNYGASHWGGQLSTSYNYGYTDSGSSAVTNFNMSNTSNLEQQNSWTSYMTPTKSSAGDTNPN